MRVALTGGVGSGKSTVATLLTGHGAVVVDADAIAREVVEPGTPGFAAVVERFGEDVVTDGRLDRPALAAIVFSDDAQRAALNAIVHPLVGARMGQLMDAAPPGSILVYDVPLLVENGMSAGFDLVVVVEADVDVRLARLARRGMQEKDARERMAVQATDEQRREVADELVGNDSTMEDLQIRVAEVWSRIRARAAAEEAGA